MSTQHQNTYHEYTVPVMYIPGIYLVCIQYNLGIYQVYTLTLVYTRYIPGIYRLYDHVGDIGGIYHTKTSMHLFGTSHVPPSTSHIPGYNRYIPGI